MLTQQPDLPQVSGAFLSWVVRPEAHTGYSNSASFAIFTLTYIYPCITVAALMLLFVLGFYNVYRIALGQNKQLGCVTDMAFFLLLFFLPCKSIQLVISNKWHFQLIVPGLQTVCVNAQGLNSVGLQCFVTWYLAGLDLR